MSIGTVCSMLVAQGTRQSDRWRTEQRELVADESVTAAEHGDYRPTVGDDIDVGQLWRDDDPDAARSAHEGGSNPDLAGRGWRAHAETVNQLAAHVARLGLARRRARPDVPQFDAA